MQKISNGIEFTTEHCCGFRDVDPFSHMNMVRYYEFFADHRFVALRERFGLSLREISKLPIGFFTSKAEIEYRRPIVCDERFQITSRVIAVSERGCEVECLMTKADGTLASRCLLILACVDMKTGRLTAWPEGFVERFYEQDA